MENDQTQSNRDAWNTQRFEAWVAAYGPPDAAAARVVADPEYVLRRLRAHIGTLTGKRFCNVQGSHGRVAVALATQGADVTVVDFSTENQRYALALAKAAEVKITYTVSDILNIAAHHPKGSFDVFVLEFGILHYHTDLTLFFQALHNVAAKGARLVLNEFHPVQRKLFWPDGPANYFENAVMTADVPNPDQTGTRLGICHYRFWTMADIVTACITAGFRIEHLEEHPDETMPKVPGTFTLTATST